MSSANPSADLSIPLPGDADELSLLAHADARALRYTASVAMRRTCTVLPAAKA